MSTRACYTFIDSPFGETRSFHVYKHHDGYPYAGTESSEAGGLVWIRNALIYSFEPPRFEADEFAAAFIAANLEPRKYDWDGGRIRLINTEHPWQFAGDSEYHYKVCSSTNQAKDLYVEVHAVCWWDPKNLKSEVVMEGWIYDLIEEQRQKVA